MTQHTFGIRLALAIFELPAAYPGVVRTTTKSEVFVRSLGTIDAYPCQTKPIK